MLNKLHLTITAIAIGGCIVLFILLQKSCGKADSASKDFDTVMKIHMRDSAELVSKTNKLGQITVTAQAYELTQKDLDKYIAENSGLKNQLANSYKHVYSVNQTSSNTHIDTIKIKVPIHDTIPCGDIDKSYPVIDRYYSFDFKFKNRAGHSPEFDFVNFNIPDTATDVIGIKKSGFLNLKHTLVSEQSHTNKYVQVKGVQTIVKSEAKPKRFGVGAFMGYGLQLSSGAVKMNPCFGLSVNYNLFEF